MPTDLHIIRTSDFLRLDAKGHLDFQKTLHDLETLAKSCLKKGVHYALLDVRKMTMSAKLSTTELHQLAEAFAESGFKKTDCLAILHPYSGEQAGIFASFAEERGMRVQAFDNYEDAMEWFSTPLPT